MDKEANGNPRTRRRRLGIWLRLILYGGPALVSVAVLGLYQYRPAPIEVPCFGAPAVMGEQYGHALQRPIRLLLRWYVEAIVCNGEQRQIAANQRAARVWLARFPDCYRTELKAAAAASKVSTDALAVGNCFLDLGHVGVGCRSVVLAAQDGLLHAHNLDWENLGGLARWTTTVVRRTPDDGRRRTVSVGFPGLIGALDIINEDGVALSFNQLGLGDGSGDEPVFLSMRRIAETCSSFADARAALLALGRGMPFIITLSAAAEGRGAVFERLSEEIVERSVADGWVAACNTAQGQRFDRTTLDLCLQASVPADLAELEAVLRHADVLSATNLYSVIFDFHNNRLHLASGKLPAARYSYRVLPLFVAP